MLGAMNMVAPPPGTPTDMDLRSSQCAKNPLTQISSSTPNTPKTKRDVHNTLLIQSIIMHSGVGETSFTNYIRVHIKNINLNASTN